MKKIFTLLISLGALTAVFAQSHQNGSYPRNDHNTISVPDSRNNFPDKNGDRNRVDNNGRYDNSMNREKDAQIQSINREYNARINAVNRKFFLSSFQKRRMINNLEMERNQMIREINMRSYNRRNRQIDNHGYGNQGYDNHQNDNHSRNMNNRKY
jgi:hypothetical protein